MLELHYCLTDGDGRPLATADPLPAAASACRRLAAAAAEDSAGLPAALRQRLAAARDPALRRQRLLAWRMLAAALHHHGLPGLERLQHDGHGCPRIAGGPAISLSHTRGLVVCALGDVAGLGVDAEHPRPLHRARMARFLPEDVLGDEPGDARDDAGTEALLRAWTAREAVVKASGRVGLARIAAVRLRGAQAWLDGRCWHLHWPQDLPVGPVCVAASAPLRPSLHPVLAAQGAATASRPQRD